MNNMSRTAITNLTCGKCNQPLPVHLANWDFVTGKPFHYYGCPDGKEHVAGQDKRSH